MAYREILEPIATSPQLPQLLQELTIMWNEEQKKRKKFYDWVTPNIKAEFIEGEIVVHSPVRSKHSQILKHIIKVLDTFIELNDLGSIGYESNMCRFPRNDYEPDFAFFDKETSQQINDNTTIFPIPQLIVEILSPSTKHRDRGVKFKDYEANGVKEYWIINGDTDIIEQFVLQEDEYVLKKAHNVKSIISTNVISGFSIPAKAFFDKKANLAALKNI
ncbi:MAG: Uma2 family endonuclease [Saprospiraceae bacterium]|jgi:Uma2 family endonuclease